MPSQSTSSQTQTKAMQKELKEPIQKMAIQKDQNPIVKSLSENDQPFFKTQTLQKKNSLPGRQGINPLMDGSTMRTTKKAIKQKTRGQSNGFNGYSTAIAIAF